jgi:septal ring factor EnvC (AmiA/AmiB activator)
MVYFVGELSESQKQEIERNKDLLLQRERELMDIRQQLAKLSKIIDKQKDEMKSIECDLRLVFYVVSG